MANRIVLPVDNGLALGRSCKEVRVNWASRRNSARNHEFDEVSSIRTHAQVP